MVMSEWDRRLAELDESFAAEPLPDIASATEMARASFARAARSFSFNQPVYRSSIQLRFSGKAVRGNDLEGAVASSIVGGFSGAVMEAAALLHLPLGSGALYLSPTVGAGSTVLELFGAEPDVPTQEHVDLAITDTPVDAAIERVFDVIEATQQSSQRPSSILNRKLGQKLYSLAQSIIECEVDLDLTWTSPRGRITTSSLTRVRASSLRNALDVEVQSEEQKTNQLGTLETLAASSGMIGFRPDGRRTAIEIAAEHWDAEELRRLWGHRVIASWRDVITSHPQRQKDSHDRFLSAMRMIDEEESSSLLDEAALQDEIRIADLNADLFDQMQARDNLE